VPIGLTCDDDIEVMAKDLIIELRGRIERGAVFGIVRGGITGDSDKAYLIVEAALPEA